MFTGGADEDEGAGPADFEAYQDEFGGDDPLSAVAITHLGIDETITYASPGARPKLIGDYVFGERIGDGSYGKVKECLNVRTLRRMAVKIMQNKKLRRIPHGQGNAKKEILLLKRLHHRNVIQLVDVLFNWEKQKIYLFMEYCAATLMEVLDCAEGKRLPLHQAQDYFRQLMCGLDYVHSQGVIHRDIKPSNMLLSNHEVLKISDFGVADVLDRYDPGNHVHSSAGTTPFQPPEIANGADAYDGCKVDVWASGVTLWNMTTGTYPFPFEKESMFSLLALIGEGRYTIPEGTDPNLAALLSAILEVDLAERLSVRAILEHSWLRADLSVDTPRVPLPPREDGDPDRGTTLVPFLDTMHPLEELRQQRIATPLDDGVDQPLEPAARSSLPQMLASFFSRNPPAAPPPQPQPQDSKSSPTATPNPSAP